VTPAFWINLTWAITVLLPMLMFCLFTRYRR